MRENGVKTIIFLFMTFWLLLLELFEVISKVKLCHHLTQNMGENE